MSSPSATRLLTPAEALRDLVHDDIDLFSRADPYLARGEFPAQSVESDVLRRYALAFRHDQTEAIAGAIAETDPDAGAHWWPAPTPPSWSR